MPSGITHMLLSHTVLDNIANVKGGAVLALLKRETGAFLLGSVAPDLPYLSIADSQLLSNQKKVADDLHYRRTNMVPFQGLLQARKQVELNKKDLSEALFAFYLGYCSHFMADGLIHPYVRDKVGDYNVAKKAHRILEMKLDVFVAHEFMDTQVNGIDFQDELDWIEDCAFKAEVYESYSSLLNTIYGYQLNAEDVRRWVSAMQRVFSCAEGEFPWWYRELMGDPGFAFKNYEDLKEEKTACLSLQKPIDVQKHGLSSNFSGKPNVWFFGDVTKGFFDRFPNVIVKSYEMVFEGATDILTLLPAIDFDTGRLEANNLLSEKPILWG